MFHFSEFIACMLFSFRNRQVNVRFELPRITLGLAIHPRGKPRYSVAVAGAASGKLCPLPRVVPALQAVL